MVRNAKPREKPYKLSDSKGLYLQVEPSGSKLWRLKYRFNGTERRLAFGIAPSNPFAVNTFASARREVLDTGA
jgi:hypothetical protein